MPPKENDRLTEKEIAIIRWVDLGAPWPDEATQKKYVTEERKRAYG